MTVLLCEQRSAAAKSDCVRCEAELEDAEQDEAMRHRPGAAGPAASSPTSTAAAAERKHQQQRLRDHFYTTSDICRRLCEMMAVSRLIEADRVQ